MTINLSTLLVATFAITALACFGALQPASPAPSGLDQAEFASNCAHQGGQFAADNRSVVCKLSPSVEVRCVADISLSNCGWTGPIGAEVLEAVFGNGTCGS